MSGSPTSAGQGGLILSARGTKRRFVREPDDARLEQMLVSVNAVAQTLTDDRSRWDGAERETA
jgi:hypothetical protein